MQNAMMWPLVVSMLLVAMPGWVYCIGDDGHRAVETALLSDQCCSTPSEGETAQPDGPQFTTTNCCGDVPLFGPDLVRSKTSSDDEHTILSLMSLWAPTPAPPALAERPHRAGFTTHGHTSTAAVLRTVILII